jgi:DNA-binding Lrp family transcriptional regulator
VGGREHGRDRRGHHPLHAAQRTQHLRGDRGGRRTLSRLDRLVADGAIRGFTALIDTQAMGWRTEAFVEVYCKGNPTPAELQRGLEAVPEVVEACTVSGPADAMVHMLARDIHHLEQAIQRVRETRVIERTESVIVLSRLIDRPRI